MLTDYDNHYYVGCFPLTEDNTIATLIFSWGALGLILDFATPTTHATCIEVSVLNPSNGCKSCLRIGLLEKIEFLSKPYNRVHQLFLTAQRRGGAGDGGLWLTEFDPNIRLVYKTVLPLTLRTGADRLGDSQ